MKNRRRFKIALSLFLTLIFLGLLGLYIRSHLTEFRQLWSLSLPPANLAGAILGYVCIILLNSELIRQAFHAHLSTIDLKEGLTLATATQAANYFMPAKTGIGLRAIYLKKNHGLPLTDCLTQVIVVTVMTMTMSAFFGLFGLLWQAINDRHFSQLLTIYFSLASAGGLFCILALDRLPIRLPTLLQNFLIGWKSFRTRPGLPRMFILQFLYLSAWTTTNWMCLSVFNIYLSPAEAMFYTAGQLHTTTINLTPAGLGLVEAFSVYAGSILDLTPAPILMAQALSRLTAVSCLTFLGLISWIALYTSFGKEARLRKSSQQTEEQKP